jgi:hypothetical protein
MTLANDRLNVIDGRMIEKGAAGPPDDRPSADDLVLLRPLPTSAKAGSTGYNHRRYRHDKAVASSHGTRNKAP